MTQIFYPPRPLANPSAVIGLVAVNGTAQTAMRSDAAPTIDQTAAWAFSGLGVTAITATTSGSALIIGPTSPGGNNGNIQFNPFGIGVNHRFPYFGFYSANTLKAFIQGDVSASTVIMGGDTGFQVNNLASTSTFFGFAGTTALPRIYWGNSADLITTRVAPATLQLGDVAGDTTGVSQTLQAQGVTVGGTANQAGGDFSLKPGQGKGNVGASLKFFGATLGASGTALQTMTEVARVLAATTNPGWQWSVNNSTGAGSAALGANCPAVTLTAPYTWVQGFSSDGSVVYWPVWK